LLAAMLTPVLPAAILSACFTILLATILVLDHLEQFTASS
jgi:hypothetical protein